MTRTPERRAVELWQKRLRSQSRFTAESGDVVRVVYPGRRNDDRGADFRDAVVNMGRGPVRGHIEIHARTGDWRAHGHHLDPCYNQVVLHVALGGDAGDTRLQNGESVPLVALDRSAECRPAGDPATPCSRAARRRRRAVADLLDRAGDDRFALKAHRFWAELADTDVDQCLYRGLMAALGYSRNKLPFIELARRSPLRIIETMFAGERSEDENVSRVQALLTGTAGLLASPCPGICSAGHGDRLERLWLEMTRPVSAMSGSDWHLFRVRPGNHPVRRIAAVSHLLYRFRGRALHQVMLDLVMGAAAGRDSRRLERAFVVTGASGTVLLGADRAGLIVVNVVLPFVLAWSWMKALPDPGAAATGLYQRYPRLAANSVERHMARQLGLVGGQVNCARRQQGLIHIYNTLCTQGRCEQCPLYSY